MGNRLNLVQLQTADHTFQVQSGMQIPQVIPLHAPAELSAFIQQTEFAYLRDGEADATRHPPSCNDWAAIGSHDTGRTPLARTHIVGVCARARAHTHTRTHRDARHTPAWLVCRWHVYDNRTPCRCCRTTKFSAHTSGALHQRPRGLCGL